MHLSSGGSDGDMSTSRAVGQLIGKVLMVPPKHFTVKYAINPWMGGVVDKSRANDQWNQLKSAIERAGVRVLTMEQAPDQPDMVFVCNSGIVLGNKVYMAKFRHKERTGEQAHYEKWFKENGYEIVGGRDANDLCFEGGGDACFTTYDKLWAGFGQRTDKAVYNKMSKLGNFETLLCELTHPNFYHLDTCFCPVDATSAIWYPPAFASSTQSTIRKHLPDSIAVSEKEANAFVCNAITIRNTLISPIGIANATIDKLSARNINVVQVDMSEFMKSGGACQCLVLKL